MAKSKYKSICIVLLMSMFFTSCEKEVKVSLNDIEQEIYDSLYQIRVVEAKTLADSLCEVNKILLHDHLKDSMLTVRLREVDDLINK